MIYIILKFISYLYIQILQYYIMRKNTIARQTQKMSIDDSNKIQEPQKIYDATICYEQYYLDTKQVIKKGVHIAHPDFKALLNKIPEYIKGIESIGGTTITKIHIVHTVHHFDDGSTYHFPVHDMTKLEFNTAMKLMQLCDC